jgi:Tfp pilus assembly protein PilX
MALVVGLIMLALMTLMVLASFNIGKSSLEIVGNMQRHNEVIASANAAIERAVSSTTMFKTPSKVFGTNNTMTFDVNGDGTDDITVTLTPNPQCLAYLAVKNNVLDLSRDDGRGCALGAQQSFGIEGSTSGDSLCSEALWEIVATATDAVTEASSTVTEGVGVRFPADDQTTYCP